MAQFKLNYGLIERLATTATAGGTTALANNSRTYQQFTGTLNQTVTLPQANAAAPNDCPVSLEFTIMNRSTGTITVNYASAALAKSLVAGSQSTFRLVDNSTSDGSWDITNEASSGGSVVTLSSPEKLSALAALSSTYYEDSETSTNLIKVTAEEIAGDFWLTKAPLPASRTAMDQFSMNGYLYIMGGLANVPDNTTVRFDESNNFWISRGNLPFTSQYGLGAVTTSFGYCAAGFAPNQTNLFAKYNDSSNVWSSVAPMNIYRGSLVGAYVNGNIYAVGGNDGFTGDLGSSEMYNETLDTWYTRQKVLDTTLTNGGAFVSTYMYYIGGYTGGSLTNHAEKYYDHLNSWIFITNFGAAQTDLSCWASVGCGFASGGGATLTQRYAPLANLWTTVAALPNASSGLANGDNSHLGLGYVIGGGTTANYQYNPVMFFPVVINKKTAVSPTAILAATAISDIAFSLPVRVRTDGDNWKYILSNQDTALKLGETASGKFIETGYVYAAGGENSTGSPNDATNEYYNRTSNTWSVKQSLPTGRRSCAYFPAIGYGYVTTGRTAGQVTSTLQYSDVINTWVTKSGNVPVSRNNVSAFAIKGFGYVLGGFSGPSAVNYQYDPVLDSYTTKTSMTTGRGYFSAFTLQERGVVVNGSTDGNLTVGTVIASVEIYNPITDAWFTATGDTTKRYGANNFAINGFGYVAGGYNSAVTNNSVEKYDPSTNSWSSSTGMNTGRILGGYSTNASQGYVFGGYNGSYVSANEAFTPDISTWTSLANLSVARELDGGGFSPGYYRNYEIQVGLPMYLAAAGSWTSVNRTSTPANHQNQAFSYNGYLYDGGDALTRVDRYDTNTDTWRQVANTSISKDNHFAFTVTGYAYMGGGNAPIANVERYNDAANAWSAATSLNSVEAGADGCSTDGFGWVPGGYNGSIKTTVVQKFNASLNTWANAGNINNGRYANGVAAGSGFIFTGGDQGSSNSFEKYSPVTQTSIAAANLLTSLGYTALCSYQNTIFEFGGYTGVALNAVNQFYIDTNIWMTRPNLNVARQSGSTGVFGSSIYVTPGGSISLTSVEQYTSVLKNIVLGAGLRVS